MVVLGPLPLLPLVDALNGMVDYASVESCG